MPVAGFKSSEQTLQGIQVSLSELIDLQVRARELILPVRYCGRNHWAGSHLSTLRGRGMDFDEVRLYSPGDDVRAMDWRVTARSNKPHIKLYREERMRPVTLVVDFSQSMFFGTKVAFKSVVAAKAAALIAWSSVFSGDRVGALMFNEEQELAIAPKARQQALLPMLKALADFSELKTREPQSAKNSLASVLEHLGGVLPSGSLIVVLSDFDQSDSQVKRSLTQLSQHHQLIAGLIYDPLEQALPDIGYAALSDGRNRLLLDTADQQTRTQYLEQFALKKNDMERFMMRLGQSFFSLATHQQMLPVLRDVLLFSGSIRR